MMTGSNVTLDGLIARAQKNADAILGDASEGYDGETELGKLLLDLVSAIRGLTGGGTWAHCSPRLLHSGVPCGSTPRRTCECEPANGGHDHLLLNAHDRVWNEIYRIWGSSAGVWAYSSNQYLGGARPIDLIQSGNSSAVIDTLRQIEQGGFS